MSPEFEARRAEALALVKRVHAGQTRSNGRVPVWHHLDRVSRYLQEALEGSGEGSPEERETIILAGLGHDSLEDTDVERRELDRVFGTRGLEIIDGMTNRWGDDHPKEYVAQVAAADDAVRLVKLSDLYDNCTSVTYDLAALGLEWTEGFFLPIVEPMIAAIMPVPFSRFPAAGERLKGLVRVSYAALQDEAARFKGAS
jgi:(p)ppGpp synthase/HD superfamily hydrolase